jgi:hypothetical protein
MTEPQPSWAYSSIKLFQQCPKKYYHLKVAKDYTEVMGPEAGYGNDFHKAAELYIRDGEPLPERFQFAQKMLDILNAFPGKKYCENKLALTADLAATSYFNKGAWFRTIIDLLIISPDGTEAKIIDYKTGKDDKYADVGQLELMAMAIFKHYPRVKTVKAGLLYVICNSFIKETYEVTRQNTLWENWLREYNRIVQAMISGTWNANPSGLCKKHCIVLSCLHNGKR